MTRQIRKKQNLDFITKHITHPTPTSQKETKKIKSKQKKMLKKEWLIAKHQNKKQIFYYHWLQLLSTMHLSILKRYL